MDSNANNNPVNPGEPNPPPPHPRDIAEPGPIDPSTGQPDHGTEVSTLKSWLRDNAISLVITALVIAAVITWLDPIDTLLVVIGLGFVIFIHELGHFLAAKWCDVHVRTFSIGFGPAVPFCSYKWGETTYMVGIIPLGGYVAMVGEGEGEGAEGDEEAEEDPRSFRKKTVGQRMLIISAGVIMNVLFGMACFVAAYLHGVKEKPATIGTVESGSAAWRAGMRTGDHIAQIGGRENPWFDDIRPYVMSTSEGEQVSVKWVRTNPDGTKQTFEQPVAPIRDEGQRFPQLGVTPPNSLTLISGGKRNVKPYYPGTPAAQAGADSGPKFEPGDRVVGMTDPVTKAVTPVADFEDYHRRMVLLRKEPVTIRVQRKNAEATAEIVVQPAYRHDLGMRMRMGKVAALRGGGPAEGKVQAASSPTTPGDRITAVMLPPNGNGKRVWFVDGPVDPKKEEFKVPGVDLEKFKEQVTVQPLDPLLLPHQLADWADRLSKQPNLTAASWTVELVVLREDEQTHTDVARRLSLTFDPAFRFDRESAFQTNSPLPLSGLGLAYWVEAQVGHVEPGGPAAAAGVRVNDQIVAVRFKAQEEGDAKKLKEGPWKDDLKAHQWAGADTVYQLNSPEIDLKVKRGDETVDITLTGRPDPNHWALDERGLIFQTEVQVQQAADVGDALRLGGLRTVRFIKTVYLNLYGYINGRISVKTLSGPLTIANVSYRLAGEDFWQFLLFLGMISVNLAVVNFLPIPVLDGGHMVFLIYEKVTGRPVPERLFAILIYAGVFLILALMLFVLGLDVLKLFFGWF